MRRFLLGSLLLCALLWAGHSSTLLILAHHWIPSIAQEEGFEISYEQMEWKEGGLHLRSLHLNQKYASNHIDSERAILKPSIDWRHGKIRLALHLERPLFLLNEPSQLYKEKQKKSALFPWLSLAIDVDQAFISLADQPPLYLSASAEWNGGLEGVLVLRGKGRLDLEMSSQGWTVIADQFHLDSLRPFLMISGILHGNFSLSKDWTTTRGTLTCTDPRFQWHDHHALADTCLLVSSPHPTLTIHQTALHTPVGDLEGGELSIKIDSDLVGSLQGLWHSAHEVSPLHININSSWPHLEHLSIQASTLHTAPADIPSTVSLYALFAPQGGMKADFDLQHAKAQEWAMISEGARWITGQELHVLEGEGAIDMRGHLWTSSIGTIAQIRVDSFETRRLSAKIPSLGIRLGADKVVGLFSCDFAAPTPSETIHAHLSIDNGSLTFLHLAPLAHFTHIHTELKIEQGKWQDSVTNVQMAGLHGHVHLKTETKDPILHFSLSGTAFEIAPFLPPNITLGLKQGLDTALVELTGTIHKQKDGLEVAGSTSIKTATLTAIAPIAFSFRLEKSSPSPIKSEELPLEFTLVDVAHQLQHPPPIAGCALVNGQFFAPKVPLETLISPFLFPEKEFELSGSAEITGTFDSTAVIIRYTGQDIALTNPSLSIDMPLTVSEAGHYVRFDTGEHFGWLPIHQASYFDKGSGLLFSSLQGQVLFFDHKVHLPHIEGYSNGLLVGGTVEVDYSNPEPGAFTVGLQVDILAGSFSNAQHFFSHFDHSFFTTLPVEGVVELGHQGITLLFDVNAIDYTLDAQVDCFLCDGYTCLPSLPLHIQDLGLRVAYDHKKNFLQIKDLEGTLLVGENSNQLHEYLLHSDLIHFSNYIQQTATFDITLEEAQEPVLRLAGKSSLAEDGLIHIVCDAKKTGLGKIHPYSLTLSLRDWNRVEALDLRFGCRLSQLVREMHNWQEWPYMPRDLLDHASWLTAVGGQVEGFLRFDGPEALFAFGMEGNHIQVGESLFNKVHFTGYEKNGRWSIEQFNLDDLQLSAEFAKEHETWQLFLLGLRWKSDLLLGIKGSYNTSDKNLDGRLDLLHANLAPLSQLPFLGPLLTNWSVQGEVKGTVNTQWTPQQAWELQADLQGNNLTIASLSLGPSASIKGCLTSKKGWKIEKGSLQLPGASLTVDKLFWTEETPHFSSLKFAIAHDQLSSIGNWITALIPSSQKAIDQIINLKTSDSLIGTCDYNQKGFQLSLADDTYQIFGQPRPLSQCTLLYAEEECTLSTLCTVYQCPLWISARMDLTTSDRGALLVADPEDTVSPALHIDWKLHPDHGLILERLEGTVHGLTLHLLQDTRQDPNAHTHYLSGTAVFDGNKVQALCPQELAKLLSTLKIGSGYLLRGNFSIGKELLTNGDRPFAFDGFLDGVDVVLYDYRLQRATAQVTCASTFAELTDIRLLDSAGSLYIPKLSATAASDSWYLHVPLCMVQELRPSYLRQAFGEIGPKKSLVITQCAIQDITGPLSEPDKIQGHGMLQFLNPQRKHLQNTIFAIPAEILTRIGLNLSVLTPVTGTIHFEIADEKFFLTKFKDVYSNDKISKFYLAPGSSFVDFEGNLDVHVRFKQSTLLLKLAELFTVTVKGTLEKPTYALQRQKYLMQQELYSSPTP